MGKDHIDDLTTMDHMSKVELVRELVSRTMLGTGGAKTSKELQALLRIQPQGVYRPPALLFGWADTPLQNLNLDRQSLHASQNSSPLDEIQHLSYLPAALVRELQELKKHVGALKSGRAADDNNRPEAAFDAHRELDLVEALVAQARKERHAKAEEHSIILDQISPLVTQPFFRQLLVNQFGCRIVKHVARDIAQFVKCQEEGTIALPLSNALPIDDRDTPYFIMGDDAFPLCEWLQQRRTCYEVVLANWYSVLGNRYPNLQHADLDRDEDGVLENTSVKQDNTLYDKMKSQDVPPETPSGKTRRASFSPVCCCGDHQATDRTQHALGRPCVDGTATMAAIGDEDPVLRLVQAQFMAVVPLRFFRWKHANIISRNKRPITEVIHALHIPLNMKGPGKAGSKPNHARHDDRQTDIWYRRRNLSRERLERVNGGSDGAVVAAFGVMVLLARFG
ncbi:hypothetical protein Bbelb_019200 [Branchiostoma belcheri]|nr:hypothetical protein Bbelb_019200 [Branchiostoma belcheri]